MKWIVPLLIIGTLLALAIWQRSEPSYPPLPVGELPELVHPDGMTQRAAEVIGDGPWLLYATASWCSPCRSFSPKLKEHLANLRSAPPVVLLSLDETPQAWQAYHAELGWPALPLNSPWRQRLAEHLDLQSIPYLASIAADGEVLATSWGSMPQHFLRRLQDHEPAAP